MKCIKEIFKVKVKNKVDWGTKKLQDHNIKVRTMTIMAVVWGLWGAKQCSYLDMFQTEKWPHGGMAERNLKTSSILPLTTLQTSL